MNTKKYEVYIDQRFVKKELAIFFKNSYQYQNVDRKKYNRNVTFFDTIDKKLDIANILLYIDIKKNTNKLIIERNFEGEYNEKYLKEFGVYRLEEEIKKSEITSENFSFLRNALPRLFAYQMDFDADIVFKNVRKYLDIKIKEECYKIINSKGFKMDLLVQNAEFVNSDTGRNNFTTFITLQEDESSIEKDGFAKFVTDFEKSCKFMSPIDETLFHQATRMTKKIVKTKK